jgi:hypothetical protein
VDESRLPNAGVANRDDARDVGHRGWVPEKVATFQASGINVAICPSEIYSHLHIHIQQTSNAAR